MRSFCTERTVEYCLIPKFQTILESIGSVAPIFYWKNREGNLRSNEMHTGSRVKIVAFFARRPKVKPNAQLIVEGKINEGIFHFSEHARKQGIPTFAGFPTASNVFDLNGAECFWFKITPDYRSNPIFRIINGELQSEEDGIANLLVDDVDIVECVEQTALEMEWQDASEIMYDMNRVVTIADHWQYGRLTYKPVYFLIR